MRVEIEKLDGLARRLKVVLPVEKVEQAYQERLKEVAKNVRIPGFRTGKIPLSVVENRFGNVVRREVASELMQSGFQQAVADNQLKIAGSPEVKPGSIAKGQELEFEVLFETLPEINLADFSQVNIEKIIAEVTDQDVERALDKLRRQHASWHVVSRAAIIGDRVKVNFDGFVDGKPFPGGSGKDFGLELGSKQMVPGFEEGLLGAQVKEDRRIEIIFPDNYPLSHLAGQPAMFQIQVLEIQEPELPELDTDFTEKVGIKGGVDALKKKLREDMHVELKRRTDERLKEQVLDKLIDLNPFNPPQSMIEEEIKMLQEMTRQQLAAQEGGQLKDVSKIKMSREPFVQQARKRVILGLLVGEAVKDFGIRSDKSKVREKVNEIVAASGYPNFDEMVAWYQQNKRLMSEVETLVLEDQVVRKLLEKAQVVEKRVTYQEVFAA